MINIVKMSQCAKEELKRRLEILSVEEEKLHSKEVLPDYDMINELDFIHRMSGTAMKIYDLDKRRMLYRAICNRVLRVLTQSLT